jgi:hypothetical protein
VILPLVDVFLSKSLNKLLEQLMSPLDEKAGLGGRNFIKGSTLLRGFSSILGRKDDKGDWLGGMGFQG